MEYIVLDGVKPYDGRWPLDATADFTTREWGVIKRLSGYLPLTVNDGFQGGDPELFAAFAVIARFPWRVECRSGLRRRSTRATIEELPAAAPSLPHPGLSCRLRSS